MEPGVRTTLRDGQIGQSPLAHLGVTMRIQDERHCHEAQELARIFSEYGGGPVRLVKIERPRLRALRLASRRVGQRVLGWLAPWPVVHVDDDTLEDRAALVGITRAPDESDYWLGRRTLEQIDSFRGLVTVTDFLALPGVRGVRDGEPGTITLEVADGWMECVRDEVAERAPIGLTVRYETVRTGA